MTSQPISFSLSQADIPAQWYNILAGFPEPLPPPLHPGTRQPVSPKALLAIFPENLVEQEAAIQAREEGRQRILLFNLSGHGLLDLSACETYFSGKLQDV
jgi:tryptophan synthase beta chain